jgi:hypothetical protein
MSLSHNESILNEPSQARYPALGSWYEWRILAAMRGRFIRPLCYEYMKQDDKVSPLV